MLKKKVYLGFIIFLLAGPANLTAQDWLDLEPLSSERGDVEKLLGEPEKHFETFGTYTTDFGKFSVWYSSGECSAKREGRQYKVRKGVLTSMIVYLTKTVPISDFLPDIDRYKKVDLEEKRRSYYVSSDRSRMFETMHKGEDEVLYSITIAPTADYQKKWACETQ